MGRNSYAIHKAEKRKLFMGYEATSNGVAYVENPNIKLNFIVPAQHSGILGAKRKSVCFWLGSAPTDIG